MYRLNMCRLKMCRQGILVLLLSGLFSSVQAQDLQTKNYRFLFGVFGTFGGDELVNLEIDTITGNRDASIDAGGGFGLSIGAGLMFGQGIEARASIGYHSDSESASNGSTSFRRLPVDASLHYHISSHSIGVGVSYILNPTFKFKLERALTSNINLDVDFDDALGFFVQYDYTFRDNLSIGARYLSTEFEAEDSSGSAIDGSYFGLVGTYSF